MDLSGGSKPNGHDRGEGRAVLVHKGGKAGAPTPSERRVLYIQQIRKGGPPPGWMARQARAWGLQKNQVAAEVGAAREALEATRTPDAAHRLAHELLQQTIEAAEEIDKDAAEIDDPEKRAKARALGATLKLRASAGLASLYRKGGSLAEELVRGLGAPLSAGALGGGEKK